MNDFKILIVDDSSTIRESVHRMIRELNEGFTVFEAPEGDQALAILKKNPDTALVFLDYNLPGMSGLEIAAAIRKDPSLQHTSLVVLTAIGDSNVSLLQTARNLGILAWLIKPLRENQLRVLLDKIKKTRLGA